MIVNLKNNESDIKAKDELIQANSVQTFENTKKITAQMKAKNSEKTCSRTNDQQQFTSTRNNLLFLQQYHKKIIKSLNAEIELLRRQNLELQQQLKLIYKFDKGLDENKRSDDPEHDQDGNNSENSAKDCRELQCLSHSKMLVEKELKSNGAGESENKPKIYRTPTKRTQNLSELLKSVQFDEIDNRIAISESAYGSSKNNSAKTLTTSQIFTLIKSLQRELIMTKCCKRIDTNDARKYKTPEMLPQIKKSQKYRARLSDKKNDSNFESSSSFLQSFKDDSFTPQKNEIKERTNSFKYLYMKFRERLGLRSMD